VLLDLSEKSSNHRLLLQSLVRCPKIILIGRHSSRCTVQPSHAHTARNESDRTWSITAISVQVLDDSCMASFSVSHRARFVQVPSREFGADTHLSFVGGRPPVHLRAVPILSE